MGQKVNPTGLRIGVIKNWESRWYANDKDFGNLLVEDYQLREFLLETLAPAGVPKVEIERDAKRVYINIHCAKPGIVIGRGGAEIEKLKAICRKKLGGKEVSIKHIAGEGGQAERIIGMVPDVIDKLSGAVEKFTKKGDSDDLVTE